MPKADHLSAAAVQLLKEPQIAHFVTLMQDGSPQSTPVWVDVADDGSAVLVNTATTGRQKLANVERNPEVAVSVVDAHNPMRWVSVRGRVAELRTEGAGAHIDALAKKYTGADSYGPGNDSRVILIIRPHHVVESLG
ncbi:PPOX class F420-dependent oxidoreductase [Chloroflexia bacterium SDU3-3]|nr:PPOX class F420-dependent oxidoreductase [Chloroflexia bacterium SDU3-3]